MIAPQRIVARWLHPLRWTEAIRDAHISGWGSIVVILVLNCSMERAWNPKFAPMSIARQGSFLNMQGSNTDDKMSRTCGSGHQAFPFARALQESPPRMQPLLLSSIYTGILGIGKRAGKKYCFHVMLIFWDTSASYVPATAFLSSCLLVERSSPACLNDATTPAVESLDARSAGDSIGKVFVDSASTPDALRRCLPEVLLASGAASSRCEWKSKANPTLKCMLIPCQGYVFPQVVRQRRTFKT
mmetsp:Transcript_133639/g.249987  ORF Transcript_133639/g.249987 Transcript_133639/m.249987 type:complete len:243 (+) Transcript_133639:658-1386(+)